MERQKKKEEEEIKPRGAVCGSVENVKIRWGGNRMVVILANRDVNRGLQTLVLNSGRLTIDMTTGKLNCVSKQAPSEPCELKPGGISAAMA